MSDREFVVLLVVSGVAISGWALFPSTAKPLDVIPLPEASTSSAAEVNSAMESVVGSPVNAYGLINAKTVLSKPTVSGSVTVQYTSSAANVSQVSVRSKLQALLMLLYSQDGGVDPAALEAKLQALLNLPDSVLAQLMEHPDLADLNKTLDAVFLGTSDLSGVKTELDKIDVTSVPGPSEKIDVVKVNGKPAYIVHTSAVQMRTEDAAGSPVSALPPPPGGPVTVTVLSLVQPPASQIMSAFTVAPTSEQLAPPPAPASQIMSDFTVAPISEQLAPPPPPPPPPAPTPTSIPTATTPTASVEPTTAAQTSQEIMSSGNKFEPGETVTKPSADNSPATQTAVPSTTATGEQSPAEAGGVTSGGATSGGATSGGATSGGATSGGATSGGGTSGGGTSSPSDNEGGSSSSSSGQSSP